MSAIPLSGKIDFLIKCNYVEDSASHVTVSIAMLEDWRAEANRLEAELSNRQVFLDSSIITAFDNGDKV